MEIAFFSFKKSNYDKGSSLQRRLCNIFLPIKRRKTKMKGSRLFVDSNANLSEWQRTWISHFVAVLSNIPRRQEWPGLIGICPSIQRPRWRRVQTQFLVSDDYKVWLPQEGGGFVVRGCGLTSTLKRRQSAWDESFHQPVLDPQCNNTAVTRWVFKGWEHRELFKLSSQEIKTQVYSNFLSFMRKEKRERKWKDTTGEWMAYK